MSSSSWATTFSVAPAGQAPVAAADVAVRPATITVTKIDINTATTTKDVRAGSG